MLRNSFKAALRNALKHKGHTFINLAGMSVSFACCLLICLWLLNEMSFDRHHADYTRIHSILADGARHTPNALGPFLDESIPEVQSAARVMSSREVLIDGDLLTSYEDLMAADPSILEVFSFPFVSGNPQTAMSAPNSIILTEETARKFFGSTDVVGKSLRLDQKEVYAVSGVVRNPPPNSTLSFDGIVPLEFVRREIVNLGFDFDAWNFCSTQTFAKAHEGVTAPQLTEIIAGSIDQFFDDKDVLLSAVNISDVHMMFSEAKRDIKIFSAIALAILLMACINFVNLSTARFRARAAEVGIRKIVGASRMRLIVQSLVESMALILVGFLLALALTEATLPFFNTLFNLQLSFALFDSVTVIIAVVGIVTFTGLASAIYPAIVLAAFQPVQIVTNRFKGSSGRFRLRRILVVMQFSLATIIIVGATTIYDQISFIKSEDVGYDKEQVVNIRLTADTKSQYGTLRNELEQLTEVSSVTGAAGILPYWYMETSVSWPGMETGTEMDVSFNWVDVDFVSTFAIELIEGRDFQKEFAGEDQTGCIVNETLARMMSQGSVIGSQIEVWGVKRTIIGVTKDFNFRPFDYAVGPLALIKATPEESMFGGVNFLSLRIGTDDFGAALDNIESVWNRVVPGVPLDYSFLDEQFNEHYRSLTQLGTLVLCFSLLAVLIAGLGLFGLASYGVDQRTRELAIRKVLGASISGIILLITREYLALVTISNVVAWPLAWYIMSRWLEAFVYRVDVAPTTLFIVGIFTLITALISAGYKAARAGLSNPVDAVRYE
jgi:ABC-type antimicrobial peptide transport system permease subunit